VDAGKGAGRPLVAFGDLNSHAREISFRSIVSAFLNNGRDSSDPSGFRRRLRLFS